MIDAAEICTRFSTIVTCWLQLISPVRDDETARVLARDECHGWLPLYNLRPPHPPPSSTAQGTEDRSSTCGGLVGMSANWGQSSEFVDIPARFTLCPNLNCVAVIMNFSYHQSFAVMLLSSFSSDLHMLKNLILFIVLVSFNSPGYDAIQGNLWPTSCMQTWSVFIR